MGKENKKIKKQDGSLSPACSPSRMGTAVQSILGSGEGVYGLLVDWIGVWGEEMVRGRAMERESTGGRAAGACLSPAL